MTRATWPLLALTATLSLAAVPAQAAFVSYVIRGSAVINENTPAPGVTEVLITAAGQKAGLGSSDIDGRRMGDIATLSIKREDDWTRFTTGSGPFVAPYLNFWVTDGAGRYAVIANEPSNAEWSSVYSGGAYNITWDILKTKTLKVFETNDKSWLPNAGVGLTFADIENYIIEAPDVAALNSGWAGLGTGAPRELGTNLAYGVNWIFGDTLSNYVSGDPGYRVSGAVVTAVAAVPEPASLALVGVGLLAAASLRRRTPARA